MPELVPLMHPNGIKEICAIFGDIGLYKTNSKNGLIQHDPQFEEKYIGIAKLAYPLILAWNHQQRISTIRCHRLLIERFEAVFKEINRLNLSDKANYFGGCYQFRQKRNGTGYSTHSWGIAIDLNPQTNRQGTNGDMSSDIVTIFKDFGFPWGGDWQGKSQDPMHFQYCTGY